MKFRFGCIFWSYSELELTAYSVLLYLYSVRISNELEAGRPRAAKFAVIIVVITALSITLICMGIILGTKDKFAVLFTNSKVVMDTVSNMAMLLGVTMVPSSVQPVLSGITQILIPFVDCRAVGLSIESL